MWGSYVGLLFAVGFRVVSYFGWTFVIWFCVVFAFWSVWVGFRLLGLGLEVGFRHVFVVALCLCGIWICGLIQRRVV